MSQTLLVVVKEVQAIHSSGYIQEVVVLFQMILCSVSQAQLWWEATTGVVLPMQLVVIQSLLDLMVEFGDLCAFVSPFFDSPAVGPEIVLDPVSVNVTSVEDNITLTCSATGFPAPSITWQHNGTTIVAMGRVENNTISSSYYQVTSTLTVRMAMTNDTGNYSCTATSSIGTYSPVNSQVVLVLVQGLLMLSIFEAILLFHFPCIIVLIACVL